MLVRVVAIAVWAAVAGATVSQAQTLRGIDGPAELPPASFKGQMFVDSRGCVFLRAGYGGTVNWVARVTRDRKPLCGYPPTMASLGKPVAVAEDTKVAAARPAPSSVPAPAAGKPMETVALTTTPPKIKAAPAPQIVPAASYAAPKVTTATPAPASVTVAQVPPRPLAAAPVVAPTAARVGGKTIGCFKSAPVAQVVALADGGTAVLCTRGDGTLLGARAPVYAVVAMGEGKRVGAGLYPAAGQTARRAPVQAPAPMRVTLTQPADVVVVAAANPELPEVVVPKGWKRAWTDDRLNPNRGRGTAAGQAQQDMIWTREVPARLVSQPVQQHYVVVSSQSAPAPKPRMVISTKSAPSAPVTKQPSAGGKLYVQVGTFGVAANADGAKARLRAAGLPVGTAKISKGGQAMQIVLAGPFRDAGAAQAALGAAHGAGFKDAFIR
jgi:cell division protein FtsN